jgi:hypothetical protein
VCFHQIRICDPQRATAMFFKPFRSHSVVSDGFFFAVLIAVKLDNQLRRGAVEIDDIRPNRLLPTKPQMRHLLAAQE